MSCRISPGRVTGKDIPNALVWPPYGNIALTVAIIIAGNGYVSFHTPWSTGVNARRIARQDIPYAVIGAPHSNVGYGIGVAVPHWMRQKFEYAASGSSGVNHLWRHWIDCQDTNIGASKPIVQEVPLHTSIRAPINSGVRTSIQGLRILWIDYQCPDICIGKSIVHSVPSCTAISAFIDSAGERTNINGLQILRIDR